RECECRALLGPHGPVVGGVRRRVLPRRADGEDVFQPVFLAPTRKAASLHTPDSLGGWLYSVARRIALRVRAGNARRPACEAQAPPRQGADPLSELTGRELCAVLDEELGHLPEGLRAPLVLCYLDGHTRDAAARRLGWSLGTLKRRLERGREALRKRLARRGLTLSAGLLAAALGEATAGAVPVGLAETTARAAAAFASGAAAAPVGRAASLA